MSVLTLSRAEATPVPREVFTARRPHASRVRRAAERLRWPLGLYTTPLLVLGLWEVAARSGVIPERIAPAPTAVLAAGWELWTIGELGPDLVVSLTRAGEGLALGLAVGVTAGVLAGLFVNGEQLFNGVFQILNTIPLLAVLPLFIVWFGIDELTKVLLIAFGAAVPIYLNLFASIRSVDQRLIEMARTTGASRRRILTRVILPGALPGALVGLRFSLAASVLGLVAAEQVNADAGIGYFINRAQTYLQTDQVYFGLVVYAVLGLAADQVVRLLERVLLAWRPGFEAS